MRHDIDWKAPPPRRIGGLALMLDTAHRVLLVEKTYREGRARFGLPGGCAHDAESARDATVREVEEELGITVRPGFVLTVHHMPATAHSAPGENVVFFCGTFAQDTVFTLDSDEIAAVRWVEPGEITGLVSTKDALRLEAALNAVTGGPVRYLEGSPT